MYIYINIYTFVYIYIHIYVDIYTYPTFKVRHIRDSVAKNERGTWISIKTQKGAQSNLNNLVESFWYVKSACFQPQEKRGKFRLSARLVNTTFFTIPSFLD
jgi:hypothetical protein